MQQTVQVSEWTYPALQVTALLSIQQVASLPVKSDLKWRSAAELMSYQRHQQQQGNQQLIHESAWTQVDFSPCMLNGFAVSVDSADDK